MSTCADEQLPSTSTNNQPSPSAITFKSWEKAQTLPRIMEEFERCKGWYERIKSQHSKIGKICYLFEMIFLQLFTSLMAACSAEIVSPWASWTMSKAMIVDDFICHQLQFVEEKLTDVDTEWLYQSNGYIDRTYLSTCLFLRIFFLFPRIWYRFLTVCITATKNEISEDWELLVTIANPPKPRRSRRIRSRKSKDTSPGKKRKHEEVERHLPGYFYVHECSQESDPDFQPNSADDDTEVTSASENSHSESDESGEELEILHTEQDEDLCIVESPDEVIVTNEVVKKEPNVDADTTPEVLAA
ncbi:uncharacterized protein [Clytia hemisphaerica]|uniref:Uncharacterized protein n=1 Tax=Clytia hemisphaerica TaxID=252671 RepID=A0A7M6DQ18_9CNID